MSIWVMLMFEAKSKSLEDEKSPEIMFANKMMFCCVVSFNPNAEAIYETAV